MYISFEKSREVILILLDALRNNKFSIDFNGHYGGPNASDSRAAKRRTESIDVTLQATAHLELLETEVELLLDAVKNNKTLDRFIAIKNRNDFACGVCGTQYGFECNGTSIRFTPACEYPNGIGSYKFIVNFHSGKVIVANDLREPFPEPEDKYSRHLDVNCERGSKNLTLYYAGLNFIHFFVSNQQCTVHKSEGDIIVGRYYLDEDEENEFAEEIVLPGKKITDICTDLWWCSIADYADIEGKIDEKTRNRFDTKVFSVKPGKYEVEVLPDNVLDYGANKDRCVYCKIKRVSD